MTERRIGGDVVVECLAALGATGVIGIPGQHALGLFDALRRSDLAFLGARVENNAGFMADGFARATGAPCPLFLSTGPGALTALPALMEAVASSIPIVVVAAQVPVAGLGGGRHGYLHELDDQAAVFAEVVKQSHTVRHVSQIPGALADAWQCAATAPQGPALVEIPQDVLLAVVGDLVPPLHHLPIAVQHPVAPPELLSTAARMLQDAANPVILAGGGAARAGAGAVLMNLAESLDAPVVSTFSGRNAVPAGHPLDAGSWLEDIATTEFLEGADVLLVVGTGLGELSSNYGALAPRGRVIHIDADLGVIGSNHDVVGVRSDARSALEGITDLLPRRTDPERRRRAERDTAALRETVQLRIGAQPLARELAVIDAIREAVPADADTFWDMTVAAYWAWSAWDRRQGGFASAQGSGGLGYAFPAAVGHAFASGRRAFAVSGDGGAMYGIAELATAAQSGAEVTWLIVDDGRYSILADYMEAAFGTATATDVTAPDFVTLASSFGVPAVTATPETVGAELAATVSQSGPRVVVLPMRMRLFAPTHLDRRPGAAPSTDPEEISR